MKVVTAEHMAALEKKAIQNGANADAFMQQAALGISSVINYYFESQESPKKVTLIAGCGNNGGDGFCAAHHLLKDGFEVTAYLIGSVEKMSELCSKYQKEFLLRGGKLTHVSSPNQIELPKEGVLLDGVFGTGFKGPLQADHKSIFRHINNASVPIFSIDIPSGISGDTGEMDEVAIVADYTIFLGLPKKGFFIKNGWDHVGKLIYADFGLDETYIDAARAVFELIGADNCFNIMPQVKRARHKYDAGFALGYCGSEGMMGASFLSGMGALRAGAGIVKLIHLEKVPFESSYHPELIHKFIDSHNSEELKAYIEKASSFYLGPGIGINSKSIAFVPWAFKHINKPMVIDADALTIMASEGIAPPKDAVLTPHHGEAARLFKLEKPTLEQLMEPAQNYVDTHGVTLVLKGGPTFIFSKGTVPNVVTVGDPGMATAGSGDVLTGVIAGLLAQGLTSHHAAQLGVYLHGKAGELAADRKTSYAMTSSDLLKMMHRSWRYLLNPYQN